MLDGVMPTWFDDPRASIVERLVRLGRSIPAGVQLGYHFCHGHERHHRERPYDAQPLVDIANALSLSLGRSLDWVHLPVEGGRVDLRFFETLGQLGLRPETRLYLGLIHPADGLVGARPGPSPRSASSTTSAWRRTAGGAATARRTSSR